MRIPYSTSPSVFQAYTQADCWALALVLAELTGFEIVFLFCPDDGVWEHVAVRTPAGMVLDIQGALPDAESVQAFGYTVDEVQFCEEPGGDPELFLEEGGFSLYVDPDLQYAANVKQVRSDAAALLAAVFPAGV